MSFSGGPHFFLLCTAGSCLLIWAFVVARKNAMRRLHWPAVEAIVESVRAVASDTEDSPEITVRYLVNGVVQITNERRFDLIPCSTEQTRAFMQRHPPGSTIAVRYNPDVPRIFYLNPPGDVSGQGWIFIGLSAVGLLLSLLGLFASLQS